jgi:hypothetical protein
MEDSFVYGPLWIGFVLVNVAVAGLVCVFWTKAEETLKPKPVPNWLQVTLSTYLFFVMWLSFGTLADCACSVLTLRTVSSAVTTWHAEPLHD